MRKCGICGKKEDQALLYKRNEMTDKRIERILEMRNIPYICVDCRNTLVSTRIHDRIRQMVAALEKEDWVRTKRKAI